MTSNTDTVQKLMLLQGISLIHDGLQFIEWAENMPNELSYDLFEILRERFRLFQECVLKGEHDHLIIDRVKKHLENVKHAQELNEQIQQQLKQLREQIKQQEKG
jgi:cell shape-determining protein MreC